MSAPVCPSLPQSRPSLETVPNRRESGGAPVAPDHVGTGKVWWGGLSTGKSEERAPQSPPQSPDREPSARELIIATFDASVLHLRNSRGQEIGADPTVGCPTVLASELGPSAAEWGRLVGLTISNFQRGAR